MHLIFWGKLGHSSIHNVDVLNFKKLKPYTVFLLTTVELNWKSVTLWYTEKFQNIWKLKRISLNIPWVKEEITRKLGIIIKKLLKSFEPCDTESTNHKNIDWSWMDKMIKLENIKWRYGETRTFLHCWWEYQMVQPLEITDWSFLF